MATPSPSPSPPPPESASHSPPSNPTILTTKKPQPVPWTHQETLHLIQAYQEKWYSLKRGQLKANKWEEVAVTVAARCGYDYDHPAKSAVQCRHKMEKLRKRFREEKRRVSLTGSSFWQYYDLMEALERGPMPISARPLALVPPNAAEDEETEEAEADEDEDDDDDDDEVEEDDYDYANKSRSLNYTLRKPTAVNRFADSGIVREAMQKRKREETEEVRIAGEIRAFTERIVGMERKKMEVMRETEKWRMEMEKKRIEMILESQRKIVGMISAAFNPRDHDC